jgi:predicted transcriptional regulator
VQEPAAWEGQSVADVMLRRPKTLDVAATVGDVRRLFENPRVETALLVEGGSFRGAIERDDLPAGAPDDAVALDHARRDLPSIPRTATVDEALEVLGREGTRRLIVLDSSGEALDGLLCLNRSGTAFCTA